MPGSAIIDEPMEEPEQKETVEMSHFIIMQDIMTSEQFKQALDYSMKGVLQYGAFGMMFFYRLTAVMKKRVTDGHVNDAEEKVMLERMRVETIIPLFEHCMGEETTRKWQHPYDSDEVWAELAERTHKELCLTVGRLVQEQFSSCVLKALAPAPSSADPPTPVVTYPDSDSDEPEN